jgi:Ni2+-binding GTPase involved in maturation of urease and hydrogenase
VERWLAEYPGTFITVQGPPGSGKVSLVSRVLKDQAKCVQSGEVRDLQLITGRHSLSIVRKSRRQRQTQTSSAR